MKIVIGDHEENTLNQFDKVYETHAAHAVLTADGHYGYAHPIGGVAAYKEHFSISGVGFDIGCGNTAYKLDIKKSDIKDIYALGLEIKNALTFGLGGSSRTQIDWEGFQSTLWAHPAINRIKDKAKQQLGTIGSGNHYVDVFYDEEDYIWIGVHFGSRGLGHTITTYFMDLLGAQDSMGADPLLVRHDTEAGQSYYDLMQLAGDYAKTGRFAVCDTVHNIIAPEAKILDTVNNHHNYIWEETHNDTKYYVVRKGATPLFPGQRGFVGSNMFDTSVILEGVDSELSNQLLYSTVHGAGRRLSRKKAAGKFQGWGKKRKLVEPGIVDWESVKNEAKERNIALFGGFADEAPECYKNLKEVLTYHDGTYKVLHELTPIIVCMAGLTDIDPYKD